MLQIRAKKLAEGYAVNVDYIDTDSYSDVLNMLFAINEEIVTTMQSKQPQGTQLHKSDYYGAIIAVMDKLRQQDESDRQQNGEAMEADGVQVQ